MRDDEIELQDVLLFSKDNFASYKYEKTNGAVSIADAKKMFDELRKEQGGKWDKEGVARVGVAELYARARVATTKSTERIVEKKTSIGAASFAHQALVMKRARRGLPSLKTLLPDAKQNVESEHSGSHSSASVRAKSPDADATPPSPKKRRRCKAAEEPQADDKAGLKFLKQKDSLGAEVQALRQTLVGEKGMITLLTALFEKGKTQHRRERLAAFV